MNFNFADIFKGMSNIKGQVGKMQEVLANINVTGEAGAGMVKVTMNGVNVVKRVEIDDNVMNLAEKEVLEELLISAFNQAQKKVRESMQSELKKITGGLSIPGFENFFM